MAHITPGGDSGRPSNRYRYLLPYERERITVRHHPAILFGPSLAVLIGLGIAGVLSSGLLVLRGDVLLAVWFAWGLLLLWLAGKTINWLVSYYIVTSDRILVISGVLAHDVAMIPFAQLININFERSEVGRLFGYGSIILDVDDQVVPVWKIKFMPYPEQLYLEICSIARPYLSGEASST